MSLKHTISSKFHIGDWILKLKQQSFNGLVHSSFIFKQHCWLLKPKPFNMYFGIKENHIQLKELKFILVFINVAHATLKEIPLIKGFHQSHNLALIFNFNFLFCWIFLKKLFNIQYFLHLRSKYYQTTFVHLTYQGLSNDTKSLTRKLMVWEISTCQTKQTNYRP
jgi:hypothetical protein